MRLYVENLEASEARIPIQWCVSKERINFLKTHQVTQPYLLISVVCENREESRYLVPLESMRTYVTFRKKGIHTIHGCIVWSNDTDLKYLLNYDKWNEEYAYKVIDVNGEFSNEKIKYYCEVMDHTSIDVNVSEEFFAKEPPEWLKNWVSNFYDLSYRRDQCDFRGQVLMSFTVKPFFYSFYILFTQLVNLCLGTWFLLIGARGIDWKLIFSPWRMIKDKISFDYIWHCYNGSIFIRGKDKYGPKKFPGLWPWIPIFPVSVFLFFLLIEMAVESPLTVFQIFRATISFVSLVSIFFGLCYLVPQGVFYTIAFIANLIGIEKFQVRESLSKINVEKKKKKYEKRRTLAQERERIRLEKLYSEEGLEPLVCNGVPKDFTINSLPAKKRTIELRFQGLKSKVCKPYSK